MSGRAGRRGKDDRGIVIQMMEDSVEPSVSKDILYGAPDSLNSSYHIKYNMLLNMMRVEDVDPEYLLRASFHQFQQEDEAPALTEQASQLEAQAQSIAIPSTNFSENERELVLEDYYEMTKQLEITQERIMKIVRRPEHILPFLAPGRLLYVSVEGSKYGWGALASRTRKTGIGSAGSAGQDASQNGIAEHVLVVLLPCAVKQQELKPNDNNSIIDDDGDDDANKTALQWQGTNTTCRPVNTKLDTDESKIEMRLFTIGLEMYSRYQRFEFLFHPMYTPQKQDLLSAEV
jgi:ATP-dependent RNA helicase DOB1